MTVVLYSRRIRVVAMDDEDANQMEEGVSVVDVPWFWGAHCNF